MSTLTASPERTAARRSDRAAALAHEWASAPWRWRDQVHHVPGRRWYTPLFETAEANAWLITWAPGTVIEPHDHGDSSATVVVVEGRLTERYRPRDADTSTERQLAATTAVSFGPEHVHEVANETDRPATSIHVYSPPLALMNFVERPSATLGTTSARWSTPDAEREQGSTP